MTLGPLSFRCDAEINNTIAEKDRAQYHENGLDFVIQALWLGGVQFLAYFCILCLLLILSPRTRRALAPRKPSESRICDALTWVREAWEADAQDSINIDGQVVVRLCKLGFNFCCLGSLVAAILTPLYASVTSDEDEETEGENIVSASDTFFIYTIANLRSRNKPRVVIVVFALYVLVAGVWFLTTQEWKHFVGIRREFFFRRARGLVGDTPAQRDSAAQAHYSIMVERVPAYASRDDRQLYEAFERVFKSAKPEFCLLQQDTVAAYHLMDLRQAKDAVSCCCCLETPRCSCCSHVIHRLDSIVDYGAKGIVSLERLPGDWLRHLAGGPTTTAFITLHDARERVVAEHVSLFRSSKDEAHKPSEVMQEALRHAVGFHDFVILPAPETKDIIWRNASMPYKMQRFYRKLGILMCAGGIILWTTPIIAIRSAATLAGKEEDMPGFVSFLKEYHLYDFVAGYLPVLAVIILMWLLPMALETFAIRFEGQKTRIAVARSSFRRNLAFRLATLYITVLTTSIWSTIRVIVQQPKCLLEVLGKSVPEVSAYFMTFVVARCATSLPLLLLGPILSLLWKPGALIYGSEPQLMVCNLSSEIVDVAEMLVIAFTYAVISPLILPLCAVYFALAGFTYKWLFINVYDQAKMVECTGLLWIDFYNGSMIGLLLGTMALSGFLIVQLQIQETAFYWTIVILLVPSIFLIVYLQYKQNAYFGPLCKSMPYEDALFVDSDQGDTGSTRVSERFRPDFYRDPVTKIARSVIEPASEGNKVEKTYAADVDTTPFVTEQQVADDRARIPEEDTDIGVCQVLDTSERLDLPIVSPTPYGHSNFANVLRIPNCTTEQSAHPATIQSLRTFLRNWSLKEFWHCFTGLPLFGDRGVSQDRQTLPLGTVVSTGSVDQVGTAPSHQIGTLQH